MRKSINLPRLLSGTMAAMLWCFAFVCPAKAEICYLPTGICEESSVPMTVLPNGTSLFSCNTEHCDNPNYYDEEQGDGWACTYDECCDKWHCIITDCQRLGFHDGPTTSKDKWPTGKIKTEGWDCSPCQQGSLYYWNCEKLPCVSGVTPDACNPETEDFEAKSEYGYSGGVRCGICIEKQCPENTYTKEQVLAKSGCFLAELKVTLGTLKCYKVTEISDFMTESTRDEGYDQSCYTFTTMESANGQMCYKATEKKCPTDQYMNKRIEGNKEICKCVDYDYNFDASKKEIVLHAARFENGQYVADYETITVTSTRYSDDGAISGTKIEDWEWEYNNTSALTLTKDENKLKITGVINESQTTDLSYTFDLVQTQENGVDKKTIKITVRIEHDTCPKITEGGVQKETKFEATCPQSGWLSKVKAASVTGKDCHICYNDNCPVCPINKPAYSNYCPTFTKTKCCGEGNYFEEVTEYGSTCYGPEDDTCPPNFTKGDTPDPVTGYETTYTNFGSNCYKQKPDDCKAVNGGKNYIKGTAPNDGHTYVYGKDTEFGSKCYIDDTCPDGYTIKKGVGESCPTDGHYEEATTNYGSKCCKPKADDCVAANGGKPYVKGTAPSNNGHTYKYGSDTPFGSHCYIDDTCPSDYTIKKSVGEACPANGGGYRYESTTTTYGSTCCKGIPDVCPDNYPMLQCPSGKQCQSTTTTNGLVCYADDTCPTGYTKGATPNSGYYHTETTPFGSNCYIDDNCPSNYPDRACGTGKTCQSKTNATAYGTTCYIDDTCPNGTGVKKGKNESCPSPNTGCIYTYETTAYGSKCCTQTCDTCPSTYPYTSCSFTRCQSTTTANGLTCYRDDSCTPGYTYGATPNTGHYCTTSTPAGNNCYKDDNCPNDYPMRSCSSGGCKEKKNATACGTTCYKQDDVCPSGYTKGARPVFQMPGYTYENGKYTYKASGAILKADKSGYTTGTVEYGDNGIATVNTPAGSQCFKCGAGNTDHGYFGDCCTKDSDCKFSTHGPLFCVKNSYQNSGSTGYGICVECDTANNSADDIDNDCRWTKKTVVGLWHDYGGYCKKDKVCTERETYDCDQFFNNDSGALITHYSDYTEAECTSDISNNYGKFCCIMAVAARDSSMAGKAQKRFDSRFGTNNTTTYPVRRYWDEEDEPDYDRTKLIRNHYKAEPRNMNRLEIGSEYMMHKNLRCASNGECTSH